MSDNELDNLFKEAAEGFKPPHDSSAWQEMASRLDQTGVTTTAFWNWKSISTMVVVGVVSVAVISYLVTSDSDTKAQKVISNQSVEGGTRDKALKEGLAEKNTASDLREETTLKDNKNGIDTESGTAALADKNSNNAIKKAHRVDAEKMQGLEEGKSVKQNRKESKNPIPLGGEKKSSASDAPVQGSVALSAARSVESNVPQDQHNVTEEGLSGVNQNSAVINDSLRKQTENQTAPLLDSVQSDEEKAKPEEGEKKFRPSLGIKLTVAPDYTSVKSSTPDGLGFGYGVLLEYRFSEHWSVATGGIWTKKIYTAYDIEYSGYNADWVDGDCRMWDIPVNVYYTFTPGKSFSFYASLGLSSYLMNEENYIYYVETPYGTYDYPQQVKGENNEWFKTLNASVGMQLKLNNKLRLQFEPTLKAPLTGVGEGEVSLVSLGAFFNLRFDIPITKH